MIRTTLSLVALSLIALVLVISGCDKSAPSSSAAAPTSTPATAPETILVGQYISLTGATATFGESTNNGVQMALQEFNAAGGVNGRSIELKTLDTASKAPEAGNCANRLITQDNVVALLGEITSTRTLVGAQVAQKLGVPDLTPTATNPKVTQVGDMIFRVCYVDSFQGHTVATFLHENQKLEKAAILFDRTETYSTGLRDAFRERWTELGGTIVAEESYAGGDADFEAQLTAIRNAKPQVVFIPGYYTDVPQIAIQARKLGIGKDIVLAGADGWDSEKLTETSGDSLEGCFFSNHYSPDEDRPAVKDFVAKYRTLYHHEPDSLAALGYDGARILFDSIKRAKSLSGRDIADAIGATKDFPGVTGNITIDANRNANKPAVIVQIKDAKPTFFASVPPPPAPTATTVTAPSTAPSK